MESLRKVEKSSDSWLAEALLRSLEVVEQTAEGIRCYLFSLVPIHLGSVEVVPTLRV